MEQVCIKKISKLEKKEPLQKKKKSVLIIITNILQIHFPNVSSCTYFINYNITNSIKHAQNESDKICLYETHRSHFLEVDWLEI